MRNVFVMHSFCESAQAEIGSNSVDISLTDLDTDVIEIEVNKRDKVLNPAQIKYLLLSNNSFNISKKIFDTNFTYDVKVYLIKLSFENISYVQESCFSVIKMISSHDLMYLRI